MRHLHIPGIAALCLAGAALLPAGPPPAEAVKPSYSIVRGENAGAAERAATDDLALYLEKMTGDKVPFGDNGKHRIFVGTPPPGDTKPLRHRETRAKSVGNDLYICGEGPQGNANAVYDFLEMVLGCRWYTFAGDEFVPKLERLPLENLDFSFVPSFEGVQFHSEWIPVDYSFFRRSRMNYVGSAEFRHIGPWWHSSSRMIPIGFKVSGVGPTNMREPCKYFKDKKYFVTNPEFFTMTEDGRRTVHQLCYSNPELRRELTKNYETAIAHEYRGGDAITYCDLNDNSGVWCRRTKVTCACPECLKLVEKYGSGAGPYYDYLLELAAHLGKKYPRIRIVALAYQLTEEPPPRGVERFPDNVVIWFSPLWKNYLKPITHPSNSMMLTNLKGWARICRHLEINIYPTVYPTFSFGGWPLAAGVRQHAENIRAARKIGVTRFGGQSGYPLYFKTGFNDLRCFILAQLTRDAGRDERALAEEFFDHVYGKVAPLMLKYYNELEKCEAEEKNFLRWCPDQRATLSYLTPENLNRWQAMFDEMEKLAADDRKLLDKVRVARMNLDEALVSVYYKFPEGGKPDLDAVEGRWNRALGAGLDDIYRRYNGPSANKNEYRGKSAALRRCMMDIHLRIARGAKPLPPEFLEKNKGKKIFQLMPTGMANLPYPGNPDGWRYDNRAAFGITYSNRVPSGDQPFRITPMTVYRHDSTPLETGWDNLYPELLDKQILTPAMLRESAPGYRLHYLGRTMLWQDCALSDTVRIVPVSAPAGHLYDPVHPRRVYDVYVSLCFDKPDTVSCDQYVLVEREDDCKQLQVLVD